jgi:hypothetical protein
MTVLAILEIGNRREVQKSFHAKKDLNLQSPSFINKIGVKFFSGFVPFYQNF